MVSRTWHGIVPIQMKNEFEAYQYETGIKDAIALEGNKGAYLKIVVQAQYAHFFLCTIWDSMESVREYAGNNPTVAVTYLEDDKYRLISDPIVIMQEVSNNQNPF